MEPHRRQIHAKTNIPSRTSTARWLGFTKFYPRCYLLGVVPPEVLVQQDIHELARKALW